MPSIEVLGERVLGEGRSSNVSVMEVSLDRLPLYLETILQNPGFALTVLAREGERYSYFRDEVAYRTGHGYYFTKIEHNPKVEAGKVAISITPPENTQDIPNFQG